MTDPTTLLGLDVAALAEYLAASPEAPDVTPPLSAAVVPGGLSHLTYDLRDAEGRAWLLRRPPLGAECPAPSRSSQSSPSSQPSLPSSPSQPSQDFQDSQDSHDSQPPQYSRHPQHPQHAPTAPEDCGLAREYRVLGSLRGRIPVARASVFCDDASVIGAPFSLLEKPAGEVLRRREQFAALSEAEALGRAEDLADVLVALHGLDPAVSGLDDPDGADAYLHRQLEGWDRRYASCQSREIRGLFELAEGLRAAVPVTQRIVLLHGAFRLANVCFDGSGVTAVLDWEETGLGDPLVDLGLLLARWDDPVRGDKMLHTGFPSGRGLADRYAAATGLIIDDLDWYIALSHYKLAVMSEGVYHRYTRGLTVGDPEPYVLAGGAVPGLVELGRVHLDKTR